MASQVLKVWVDMVDQIHVPPEYGSLLVRALSHISSYNRPSP
jgi:hypothetical protein